jgi:hypothetical protein
MSIFFIILLKPLAILAFSIHYVNDYFDTDERLRTKLTHSKG